MVPLKKTFAFNLYFKSTALEESRLNPIIYLKEKYNPVGNSSIMNIDENIMTVNYLLICQMSYLI
jgi:hypothetical protein